MDERSAFVIKSAIEHMEYARTLLHDLMNIDPEQLSFTAVAAEQAVEMDLRHAVTDAGVLGTYLPTMGGAV